MIQNYSILIVRRDFKTIFTVGVYSNIEISQNTLDYFITDISWQKLIKDNIYQCKIVPISNNGSIRYDDEMSFINF